jgi:hypothetical protein
LRPLAQRSIAVGFEQGRDRDRIGFKPRSGGTARHHGQSDGSEDRQDGEDTYDLKESEATLPSAGVIESS